MIRVVGPNPALDRTQLMPPIILNRVNRSIMTVVHAGGKGLDVARTVKKLGHEVAIYGFVGGMIGEYLKTCCEQLGIIDRHTIVDSETRVCNIVVEESGRVTVFNEKGPDIADPDAAERLIRSLEEDTGPDDIVILSGSLPGNIPVTLYSEIIRRLHPKGAKFIVDASGEVMSHAIEEIPWMIKPNLKEFGEVMGQTFSADDLPALTQAMRQMVDKGIAIVSVTLGEKGVITVTQDDCFLTRIPQVNVVNPTASGDTYLGGFAVKYSESQQVRDAVHFATVCSVANVMTLAPELPDHVDLNSLSSQVEILPFGGVVR